MGHIAQRRVACLFGALAFTSVCSLGQTALADGLPVSSGPAWPGAATYGAAASTGMGLANLLLTLNRPSLPVLSAGVALLAAHGSTGAFAGLRNRRAVRERTAPASMRTGGLRMLATAYDAGGNSNGPWGAVDYFGQPLRFGDVAVDPKVIPLGSRLFISGYSDPALPKGGFYARAVDEGGAIRGDRVDVFIPGRAAALTFGMEHVRVKILPSS